MLSKLALTFLLASSLIRALPLTIDDAPVVTLSGGRFSLDATRTTSNGTTKRSIDEIRARAYKKHGLPESGEIDSSLSNKEARRPNW